MEFTIVIEFRQKDLKRFVLLCRYEIVSIIKQKHKVFIFTLKFNNFFFFILY